MQGHLSGYPIPKDHRAMIFCAHNELRWQHAHSSTNHHSLCTGLMRVDEDTVELTIWTADCDKCGETIGITPAQQRSLLEAQGAAPEEARDRGEMVDRQETLDEATTPAEPPKARRRLMPKKRRRR